MHAARSEAEDPIEVIEDARCIDIVRIINRLLIGRETRIYKSTVIAVI